MTRRAAAVAVLLLAVPAALPAQSSVYEQLQTFSGLLNQIRLNYADSVAVDRLMRGAIDGMLSSLDPHSYFLSHVDGQRMMDYRGRQLGGTGMALDDLEDAVVVQSVARRGPAERAGVQPGDRVLAVNDTSVAGLRSATVEARLLGPQGRRVRVRLERGSRLDPESVTVQIRFEVLPERSVALARSLGGGVGYVRLDEFGERAAEELKNAAQGVMGQGGPRRLILDLRGNPGGIVNQAVDIVSLFLPRDQLVFRTRGRRRESDQLYKTTRNGEFRDVPVVVLIDERSASASEAVAGALQDHDRALIVGRRSFGKALMQRAFLVPPQNDLVMLTVGWVELPSGRLIQRPYRGMTAGQYRSLAGQERTADSSEQTWRTNAGRVMRAGGGVTPDSMLPAPPSLPAWFTAAADSGLLYSVTDSVAQSLGADQAARDAWFGAADQWHARLVQPLLARVRARLGIAAQPDSAVAARIGRIMADRVVEVRWGPAAEEDFRIRHDPGIAAARRAIAGLPVLIPNTAR